MISIVMIYVITGFVTFIVTGVINLYHNQSGVKYGHSQLMFHTQIYLNKKHHVLGKFLNEIIGSANSVTTIKDKRNF